MLADGPLPTELLEMELAKRMGWTLTELDDQDMSRVMPGVHAMGVRDSLGNILAFLHSGGKIKPADDDLKLYGEVKRLMDLAKQDDG